MKKLIYVHARWFSFFFWLLFFVVQQTDGQKIFTGAGNFSDATKWTGGTVPVAGDNLVIDGACTVDNNAGTNNVAYGTLTIGTSIGRTLNWVSGGTNRLNASAVNAGTATNILDMSNGGTLVIRGSWSSTNLSFTPGTGTIELQSNITLPVVYPTYNNLTVNGSGITVSLGVTTTISANLSIASGTFSANNFDVNTGGNWINNGSFTAGAGTANFIGTTVISGTTTSNVFNNLAVAASAIVTSSTGITSLVVNGTLTTGTSAILDLGITTLLSGTLATINNTGTIKTAVPNTTSSIPIPSGKTWGGTLDYTNTNPGQIVVAGTYNNLTVRPNSAQTTTAGGNLVVNGTLTNITNAANFDLTNYVLSGALTSVVNNGWIRTSVPTTTSAAPIPAGKNWGASGGVEYYAATGAQTIVGGTYWILYCSNTSGINTAAGDLTATSQLLTVAGGIVDLGSAYQLLGLASTITNNGTIRTSVLTTTSATPVPAGKTWGGTGTVEYAAATGAQTVAGGTFYNLKLSNTSGTNTLSTSVGVNGILNLSAGTITTGAATITINATASISRSSGYVVGNLRKWMVTGATAATFEIGTSTATYTPVSINFANISTAGYFTATSIGSDHPNIATSTIASLRDANRYWTLTNTGIVFNTYDAVFTFVSGDLDASATTSAFIVGRYNAGWSYPTVGTKTSVSTQTTGLTGFGDFAVGEACSSPVVSGTSTATCVGGSTGTITGSATGGVSPYTYSLNAGAYAGVGVTTFTALAAATYTLNVKTAAGCVSSTPITVSPYPNSTDDQTTAGNNSWVGHVYSGIAFGNYIGHYTEAETFNELFGGSTVCFSVNSTSLPASRSIYTEVFSAKYRMNSTKKGLYVIDLGSDDGSRLTVDGTMVYNNWSAQSYTARPTVLMSLTGTSALLFEYFEQNGGNQVSFQNFTAVLANALATNTNQNICLGNTGLAISGDVYGTLPAGITVSGTGYQWTYSTTPGGIRTNISGATAATYSPSASIAPFNANGTYYIYRNASLSSTKNISPVPYAATNESNAATITVSTPPAATISYTATPYCSSAGTATVSATGTTGGTYSSTGGLVINSGSGDITLATSTPGPYTVTYTMVSSGCTVTATTPVVVSAAPAATINYALSPYCTSAGTAAVTRSGTAGGTYSSTSGLTINAATGDITLSTSTPATYTVTYTIAASGGCALFSTTANVTISATSSATIGYTSTPYCSSAGTASVTMTGTAGGSYSAAGGLVINSSSGAITLASSTPGTYLVTYTMVNGGCTNTATTSVTITAAPAATISYAANPYCSSGGTATVTRTGSTGGSYASTAGIVINSATGDVTLPTTTPGTYTVTYTIAAAGGCALFSTSASITVFAASTATITYGASPYCANAGTISVTRTGNSSGTYSAAGGLSINTSTGAINSVASSPGSYIVTYTVAASGGCSQFSTTASVTITVAPASTIGYTGTPFCTGNGIATVTRTGTSGGTFSSTTGLIINAATGDVNLTSSVPGYYTITYTIAAIGGCAIYSTNTNITLNAGPAISQIPSANIIANYKFEGNAYDATGNDDGTLQNSPAQTADRFNNANKAYSFNGSTQYVSTAKSYVNPGNFTLSIWFKTTSVTGGKLIGFGNAQTGVSGQYDRHIYMTNSGQIYFGVYPGLTKTVTSALSYNDGNWHLVTASLSSTAGMVLYMDGVQVGTNPSVVTAENYTGYWRIGFDNVNGWPGTHSSNYFGGSLDDALIYQTVLTPAQVSTLYKSPDGAGNNGPVCTGSSVSLTATSVAGAVYAWSGPGSFSSFLQNPAFIYSAATAGVYTLQVTAAGCTATAFTNVTATTNAGQWTGNNSTDWTDAGNWCAGIVPTSATNVVITSTAPRMPVITTTGSCNNLTVNAGATVTTAAAGTLNIAGNIINNGTMTNSGTTVFNGTGAVQTFSGISTFYNLTLNNTNGLLLPASITVNGNLLLTAGTLTAGGFGITLKGSWTNNASAAAFAGASSTVTFNGTIAQVINGTFVTTFNNLIISATASTVGLNVNIGVSGDLTIANGILDLGAFSANRASAGGTFTISNNAVLKIGGTNSFPINYAINALSTASTVEYSGTNQNVATEVYGNLTMSSSAGSAIKNFPSATLTVQGNLTSTLGAGTTVTFTAASNINVAGSVSIGASTIFSAASYLIGVGANWVNNGTFNGNTSTVTFTGSGSAIGGSGGQNFNSLTVANSGITFSSSSITLSGNLATTGTGSFIQASGGTLLMTGTGSTINGAGISIDNLSVSGTDSTSSALTITGNIFITGSFTATSGSVNMSGVGKTLTGTGVKSFGVLSIIGSITTNADFSISSGLTVTGTLTGTAGTATFTGTSTISGIANLFNVVVNGTSLQLSSSSVLGVASVLTMTAGTLNVTSSTPNTVNFNGTGAQNINAVPYNNLTLSNGNNKTAIAGITVNNSITIATGTTFVPGAFTHSINNNWNNYGIFAAGTSTIQFVGSQNSNLYGASTFNILAINKATSATNTLLQSNVTASTVNMVLGTMLTGTNTLTLTTTRTGTGIILGYIQHSHSFTTGTAYAFEGPDNTITFSSVSGVSSITVFVAKGSIPDFPFGGSISRVYNITVPSGSYNATLRLHYEDGELNGNIKATMGLWTYNGSTWNAVGKTSNSTTANYVELSGLTNITNRWTCSDNLNVVQWNGSVSTDWNTAANWTVLQGSASRPPAPTDIVNLGTATFTNNPTISTNVVVKNIIFGSVQALALSMATGGFLTTGDIHGSWGSNTTHTINTNNQSVTINGDLALSDGVAGHAINLTIGSGTVSVSGLLTQSGGANITFSGAGNIIIAGDYNYVNGTFIPATGTVTYNGATNQSIGAVTYNNLTINKSAGLASISSNLTVGADLNVTAGELDNFAVSTILGNVTLASGATLYNNNILHVGGNWANNGNYIGGGINVIFDGGGTQTISPTTFNNLTINKPVGSSAVLTGNIVLNGDLTVNSGTFNILSFNCNRSVQGGTLILADSATFIVSANNSPLNFSNGNLATSSTVIADGTSSQLIFGVDFGNLIFRNAGIKTLVSPINVKGNLTIETGATFDASSQTLTLLGNWINNGTFVPTSSTLLFNGSVKTVTGNTTFNKLTVSGSYSFLSNMTFNGLLNIPASGSLSGGSSIVTTLNGDLFNSGTLYTLGTTTFTGNVLQTFSLINAVQTVAITVNFNGSVSPVLNSTSAPQFGYLNINNTGGINPSVGWTVAYGLTVGSGGIFNGGSSSHTIQGFLTNNGTITSSGTLTFIPATAATINLGSNFTSTGRVYFAGAGAMTLAGTPISFKNVNINNSNAAGITPSSAWTLTGDLRVVSGSVLNASNFNHLIGGNISNSGTINRGTSTFTLNGSGTQDINTASAFNNLTVNKSAGLATLSANTTINGVLNFVSGNIQTGSNILIETASATLTGAAANTGWINGKLQKNILTGATTKSFEVGDTTRYTPVVTAFSNVTTSGDLIVFTTPGDHPNINSSTINPDKSVNRFWTIINSGIVFTNYAATFNFVASDIDAGSSTPSFGVEIYNGSSWSLPAIASPNATNIQATGVTAMGDFSIGEACNAGTTIFYSASPYCLNSGTAVPTVTGTTGGTFSADAGLPINSTTGAVDLTLSTLGTYVVTYTIPAAGQCGQFITNAPITIGTPGLWTGAISTDWNNAGNWSCAGVPIASTNVFITGRFISLPGNFNNQPLNSISIENGASLTVSGGTLQVGGSITNAGIFDVTAGTLEMNGTVAQTIPANSFSGNNILNLVISNNVSLGGTQNLTGALFFWRQCPHTHHRRVFNAPVHGLGHGQGSRYHQCRDQ